MRYIAHFTPEAWIRNYATEVDAEGPQTWDCTAFAGQHADYVASRGTDDGDPYGLIDTDDVFKADPAAPQWVRDWHGPFTIRIRKEES